MNASSLTRNRAWRWLAVAVLPLYGACDSLTGANRPDELDVTIESDDVGEVLLVTSTDFIIVPDPECPNTCPSSIQLVISDTTTVSLPFQRRYAFTSTERYYVETYPTGLEPVTLFMRVDIDGREWYNDRRTLQPPDENGERETLQFVYRYRIPTLP